MTVDLTFLHKGETVARGTVEIDEAVAKKHGLDIRKLTFESELAFNTHVPTLRLHTDLDPARTEQPGPEDLGG